MCTPSTSRSARQSALRAYGEAKQGALGGLLSETPHTHGKASDLLRDLEQHLTDASYKQARWRGLTDAAWPLGAYGVRVTDDAVCVTILRREMHAVEESLREATVDSTSEVARLREQVRSQAERTRRTETELQHQLAEATHGCWRAKEELASAMKMVATREKAGSTLEMELSSERGAKGSLEQQVAELRSERDAALRERSECEREVLRAGSAKEEAERLCESQRHQLARLQEEVASLQEQAAAQQRSGAAREAGSEERERMLNARVKELEGIA